MDLRALLAAGVQEGADRRPVFRQLLDTRLWVRRPAEGLLAVTSPETGQRAIPAFLTEREAVHFWQRAAGARKVVAESIAFSDLVAAALGVGAVVIDPEGAALLLTRSDLLPLAAGVVPGEFSTWLREVGRLGRDPREVSARLRASYVHVITSKGAPGAEPRLYLLEKSQDGTLAVPCFASPDTLAQFGKVRGLFAGEHGYAVGMLPGEQCLRVAAGLGAYVLVDPESPWETQIEPTLG
jgi:hypothetical protein